MSDCEDCVLLESKSHGDGRLHLGNQFRNAEHAMSTFRRWQDRVGLPPSRFTRAYESSRRNERLRIICNGCRAAISFRRRNELLRVTKVGFCSCQVGWSTSRNSDSVTSEDMKENDLQRRSASVYHNELSSLPSDSAEEVERQPPTEMNKADSRKSKYKLLRALEEEPSDSIKPDGQSKGEGSSAPEKVSADQAISSEALLTTLIKFSDKERRQRSIRNCRLARDCELLHFFKNAQVTVAVVQERNTSRKFTLTDWMCTCEEDSGMVCPHLIAAAFLADRDMAVSSKDNRESPQNDDA